MKNRKQCMWKTRVLLTALFQAVKPYGLEMSTMNKLRGTAYKTTRCQNLQNHNMNSHYSENLKSHMYSQI
jgi:hypothetical protein